MNNKKAFFLLEVMLTVAVLSVGLVFVIRAINMSMKVAKATFNYSQAIHLVYEKAFDLEITPELHDLKENLKSDEGHFENKEDFSWKYSINKFDDYNLSSMSLDVTWQEGKRESGLGIDTYLRTWVISE